jgi:hypothetical protein
VHSETFKPRSTSTASVNLARALNSATGGDALNRGMIDVYPGNIDYAYEFVTGGLGRFLTRSVSAARNTIDGIGTPKNQRPIVRTFAGDTDRRFETRRWYDHVVSLKDEAKGKVSDAQDAAEAGTIRWSEAIDIAARAGVPLKEGQKKINWKDTWIGTVDRAEKELSGLRDTIDEIHTSNMPRASREEDIRAVEQMIENRMRDARAEVTALRALIPSPPD